MENINLIPVEFVRKYEDENPDLINKIIREWGDEYYIKQQQKTIQEQAVETIKSWFNQ